MRRNQRNMLIVGIVMLLVGVVIGVLAGEDLPIIGTVAPEPEQSESQASDSAELYYLVPLEDAQAWLTETYPDAAESLVTDIAAVQEIATMNDYRAFVDEQGSLLDGVLNHTQAALIGVENVDEATDFAEALPRELEVTACLGIDEDPFADTGPAVLLYLVVPDEDAGKNIPSTWEAGDPKTGTSMFWTALRCSPLEE